MHRTRAAALTALSGPRCPPWPLAAVGLLLLIQSPVAASETRRAAETMDVTSVMAPWSNIGSSDPAKDAAAGMPDTEYTPPLVDGRLQAAAALERACARLEERRGAPGARGASSAIASSATGRLSPAPGAPTDRCFRISRW